MKPEIVHPKNFVNDIARFIADTALDSIDQRGTFYFALSGGNTPRAIYQALALMDCDWKRWSITFGDERCVPPDDKQSNYRMASEAFLLVTDPGEVYRIKGELDPATAADDYENVVSELAGKQGEKRLRHDLILLGIGEEGHTASLFPDTPGLHEKERNIVPNFIPKLNADRVTFTFPLINAARRVAFLANDEKKKSVIDGVLVGDLQYPATQVRPDAGELYWFLGY